MNESAPSPKQALAKKSLLVPAGEVDRIRQELAILKSRVEMLGSTVEQASQHTTTHVLGHGHASSSLLPLSASPRLNRAGIVRVFNYALWFVAFVWLARLLLGGSRRP